MAHGKNIKPEIYECPNTKYLVLTQRPFLLHPGEDTKRAKNNLLKYLRIHTSTYYPSAWNDKGRGCYNWKFLPLNPITGFYLPKRSKPGPSSLHCQSSASYISMCIYANIFFQIFDISYIIHILHYEYMFIYNFKYFFCMSIELWNICI